MLEKIHNKKIAIDIDDVISITVPNLINFFKNHHNIDIEYDDFDNYRLDELRHFVERNIDKPRIHDMWNEFYNSEYAENMELVPGSKDMIDNLLDKGYDITLITARWESLRPHTTKWLNKRLPEIEFKNLYFTGVFNEKSIQKSQVCLNNSISFMIEDNAENCLDLSKNGIKSYLITRPWNTKIIINDPNITRVSGWHEIK